jgi:hypothetical protein
MPAILAWLIRNPLVVVVALLSVAVGVQTFRLNSAQAAEAKAQLAFSDFKKDLAEKTAAEAQANQKRSDEKAQALANDFTSIMTTASEVREALDAAKSSGACEHDPKWRATVGGMRAFGQGRAGVAAGKTN